MHNKGLTLIELLIVIAIIGILAAMAMPSFNDLLRRQEINGQANALFSMLYLARSEAIKRSSVVTICKSSDGQNCGGNWSNGWLMFADQNKDGALDTGEIVISQGRISENIAVGWVAFGSNNYIRFIPRGMTLAQNGTFTVCPKNADELITRAVVVSKTARVRIPPAGENIVGEALTC
ncbi:MAG TPA: GspH/FimT family pseudopilin [Methylotenera sp.]|nr:GspH/FimT family pseudopilin [Methylotenera sp.]